MRTEPTLIASRTPGVWRLALVAVLPSLIAVAPLACQHTEQAAASISFERCGSATGVVECGQLAVREQPRNAGSRQLQLRIVRIRRDPAAPATAATFILAGGPGAAASEMARGDLAAYDAWAEHGDVIFMDQRGTETGSPLRCAVDADWDPFDGIFPAESLSRCRDDAARVVDLAAYGTAYAAADIEFARVALGYDQVNLVGVSYGTRLAMEYMERYPGRTRSAVLDGVVPRDLRAPLHYVADAEAALDRLAELCSDDAGCRRFGDPAARFRSIMSRLAAAPATTAVRFQPAAPARQVTFGPEDFAYVVRALLYGDAAVQLPRLLAHADATGDITEFAQRYAQRVIAVARGSALGVHLSVLCAEDVLSLTPQHIRDATGATTAGSYLADQYVEACERWRVPAGRADTTTARLEPPLLLLSGALDPVTPPRWADMVNGRAANARHVVFPYGGHAFPGAGMAACKNRLVGEFLRTAQPDALDTGCVAGAPRPRFAPLD